MRAKIIADIAVVIVYILLALWWFSAVPFPVAPKPYLTGSQTAAMLIALVAVIGSFASGLVGIIYWIHKGK